MMKWRSPYVLALLVTVAAASWLFSGQIGGRWSGDARAPASAGEAAAVPAKAVRVVLSLAEQREEAVRLFGQTEAARKVILRAELDGKVIEVPAGRGARLRSGDTVARMAIDDRIARLQEAKALLTQRRIELDAARDLAARGHRSPIAVAESQAKFDAAAAALKGMEIETARTTIVAPFAGVVETRTAEIGSYLKTGDPIATIVDLDPIRIVAHVSERDIGRIAVGATARVRLADGAQLEGQVTLLGVVADGSTRTFRVEVELPNPDFAVRDGLTAELYLPVALSSVHRVTPAILTLGEDGAIGVKTVDEDGRVRFLPARIAGEAPGGVWLTGLPERVTLVVVGQEFVREGEAVRAVALDPSAANGQSLR